MNKEDIIRMAREAELNCHMHLTEHGLVIEDLEHFAALVAAAERRKFCATLRQLHDVYSLQSDVSSLRARSEE